MGAEKAKLIPDTTQEFRVHHLLGKASAETKNESWETMWAMRRNADDIIHISGRVLGTVHGVPPFSSD